MPNRLKDETSPYLLQHANNPVHWYPWGREAFQKAKEEDRPILLSVGYAACHWCHVMAHESFEDPDTAAFMNNHFVNVKVDREERPDIDDIYMRAVVAMTGQGGWPMTVALTPNGEPFFGGTYFPPVNRYGMPSYIQVLKSLVRAWNERREELMASALDIAEHIRRNVVLDKPTVVLDASLLSQVVAKFATAFDARHGGFGGAPKFPPSMALEFLLRRYLQSKDKQTLHIVEFTLEKMARGGLYDQIGGGFARYSTDNEWLVPHFEKMLYDNGLLARLYLHAWRVTKRPLFRRIVEETLDWLLREMKHMAGGFYSSMDADSEGAEGRFYVWEASAIRKNLGEDAELFMSFYGVTDHGNWEESNILHIPRRLEDVAAESQLSVDEAATRLSAARTKLYEVRAKRVWPNLDDKILTAWNGLVLAALAEAGRDLERSDYQAAALENAFFLYERMRREDGRLWRTWREGGEPRYNAYLEDYAYLADGLLSLYESTFDERWFAWALELAEIMRTQFQDEADGGFFDTSHDHERLIHRPKGLQDNATPSGNAMASLVLLRLSLYTGQAEYWDHAQQSVSAVQPAMIQYPTGFSQWLCAADFMLSEPREVAVIGDPAAPDTKALANVLTKHYQPHLVSAIGQEGSWIPLLANRKQKDGRATAFVCRKFVCQQPVNRPEALAQQLTGGVT